MTPILFAALAVGMTSFITAAKINKVAEAIRHLGAGESKTYGVRLHTGNPGEAGTANIAGFSERKAGSWAEPVAGKITNEEAIIFTPFAAEEKIEYIGLWESILGGAFIGWIKLAEPVTVPKGGSFELPVGQVSELVEAI